MARSCSSPEGDEEEGTVTAELGSWNGRGEILDRRGWKGIGGPESEEVQKAC